MCGIAGIASLSGVPVERHEVERMTAMLRHRGPDGDGLHIENGIGLGHTRLSVLDVSESGAQPMALCNNRYWVTFNGEIYNFIELRDELRQSGWTFATETDTEVILAAFAQWGPACQMKFNGMWAFAIWDRQEQLLFLSRDRFGVKPLHYTVGRDYLAFASEMKAFLPLPWFDPSFDPSMVALAISNQTRVEGTEMCLLRDVHRLPAGHHLVVRAGSPPKLERWWRTLDHLVAVPDTLAEQAEQLRELLLNACALRLRSDVPVGTALSGGMDSSSVHVALVEAARARRAGGRASQDWQRAFVADFPGSVQDERAYAEEVVRHVGTSAHICTMRTEDVAAAVEQAIYAYEDIQANHTPVWMLYRAYREAGVVVSLDGHGGDELFLGYHHHLPTAIETAPNSQTLVERIRIRHELNAPGFNQAYGGFGLTHEMFIRQEQANPPFAGRTEDAERYAPCDRLTRQSYADFHNHILPTILRNFDRASMAHGVEVRAPFLDWRLVCFAFSLPSSAKIGKGFTKLVLREAMRGLLPESVRTRKSKLGFVSPTQEWVTGPLKSWLTDTLRSQEFLESSIWDGRALADVIEYFLSQNEPRAANFVWTYLHATRIMSLFQKEAASARQSLANLHPA
ncbi:asparagine synthase (glutamine-hydrolyzing) [Azospirillum tabaci]|uniref:asparagine synthase (glutamine-hydrolyzing) n=1 Tax=Azospirillum tabaci TaxID=2752310 RepID=UPI00166118C6|nr:asparagine synthase (glutamine-hydrolyzing) [Azospirillum tabaci]